MTKNIKRGNGHGYLRNDGTVGMIHCFECGKENYAMAVSSGRCVWCGYDANVEERPMADFITTLAIAILIAGLITGAILGHGIVDTKNYKLPEAIRKANNVYECKIVAETKERE